MANKKVSALCAMLMLALTGCSSDEPQYREYQTEDGRTVREYVGGAPSSGSGGSMMDSIIGSAIGSTAGSMLGNKLSESNDRDRRPASSGYIPTYPAGSGSTSSYSKSNAPASSSSVTTPSTTSTTPTAPKANITARGGFFGGLGAGS